MRRHSIALYCSPVYDAGQDGDYNIPGMKGDVFRSKKSLPVHRLLRLSADIQQCELSQTIIGLGFLLRLLVLTLRVIFWRQLWWDTN